MADLIDFQVDPDAMRHWRVDYDGAVATLWMDVDETAGLFDGYALKLNSYDLGVDIELADVVQRMRFEHHEVRVVVMRSARDRVFCAGANIRMLGGASHAHKVNFCKFTNETRNTFEAALEDSDQNYICAIQGSCAGGGYELALACNHIMLTDDSTSAVALPEVPLLAVLPGTGGLTRVTDKRRVRRDRADVFCSLEEGVRGRRALEWGLVDEVFPNASFDQRVAERAQALADASGTDTPTRGITLNPLDRSFADDGVTYSTVRVAVDRPARRAVVTILGPQEAAPADMSDAHAQGDRTWMLRCARELDDAILHLRSNEDEIGLIEFQTAGDPLAVAAHEAVFRDAGDHWLAREVMHYWKRVLKRVDMTSRSLAAIVEHGSCYTGVLAELLWAADRSYMMLDAFDDDDRPLASVTLTAANFGSFPMGNGLSRLETRFLGVPEQIDVLRQRIGEALEGEDAEDLGLVTWAFDDIDWEDEVRLFREERASFSPDAMTGMEANLRFAGPETMETKIFGRLTAWQNWIFQRPNAVGPEGALQRYGSGLRGQYNMQRV
ncbi:2,3-epoxybenzoyl-CoA dihydrolase [uncultured Roseobacter sp.]|uniref:2,3-epoxybenzoyl-CoA dihydrolase n=1 Tax=uncultured Roseobacter sp. TaxID=114847 RepID=UPI0026105C95|nr:2,3-epoxybenzoyl-CoA dihydrolase [uncultured Roseobacter sp.]